MVQGPENTPHSLEMEQGTCRKKTQIKQSFLMPSCAPAAERSISPSVTALLPDGAKQTWNNTRESVEYIPQK